MLNRLPLLALLLCLPCSAAIYKWVDENGKTQYSDSPPQKQSKSGTVKMNNRGMVVEKTEYLSPEQLAKREQEALQKREQDKKDLEARRRDKALLNSFTRTSEIDTLRDRNLEQLQASVTSDRGRIEAVQRRLDTYRAKAAKQEAAQRPVSEDLQNNIREREADLAKLKQSIKDKEQEMSNLRARAEADKKRLVELRGPIAAGK